MAIANLKKEIEVLVKQLENPTGDGSNNPLRRYMNSMFGNYTFSEEIVLKQLKAITRKIRDANEKGGFKRQKKPGGGYSNVRTAAFGKDDQQNLKAFAKKWVATAKIEAQKKSPSVETVITEKNGVVKIDAQFFDGKATDQGIFKYFQTIQANIIKSLRAEEDDIITGILDTTRESRFENGKQGPEALFDVGHIQSVAENKLSVLAKGVTELEGVSDVFGDEAKGKELLFDAAQRSVDTLPFKITLNDNIEIGIGDKGFTGSTSISYQPEAWSVNQIDKNAQDQALGKLIKKEETGILAYIDKLLAKQLEGLTVGSKAYEERKGSDSLEDMVVAKIIHSPQMRKMFGKGVAKNLSKHKKAPRGRKNSVDATAKIKMPKRRTLKGGGIAKLPKGTRKTKGIESGAGNNLLQKAFETRAFVNSRLAKTVAGNMGRPALENQTGRFARSAQVTNAMAVGNQIHMDYTYSPLYRVFEDGSEYTANYDPRPLIERSIRELAAARLETKFTLRRV